MKKIIEIRKSAYAAILLFGMLTTTLHANPISVVDDTSKVKEIGSFNTANYVKPKSLSDARLLNLNITIADDADAVFTGAFAFGGSEVIQIGAYTMDDAGYRYVTGGFTGQVEFGDQILTSNNGFDFYIAKFDPDNNVVWARMAHGTDNIPAEYSLDGGLTITVDPDGDIYVGGGFVKSLTFLDESGSVAATLTDGRNDDNLNVEMFLAHYFHDGELGWVLGGDSNSQGLPNSLAAGKNVVTSVVLSADGDSLYFGGAYSGTNFLGLPFESYGKSDMFLAVMSLFDAWYSLIDSDNYEAKPDWFIQVGTPEDDQVDALTVDMHGYVNMLGSTGLGEVFINSFEYNSVEPLVESIWVNESEFNESLMLSIDGKGAWYFGIFMGAGQQILSNAIYTEPVSGDFFISGYFAGEATFIEGDNPSNYIEHNIHSVGARGDGFIARFDFYNGDLIWVRQFGHDFAEGNRIVGDDEGNIYVMGRFSTRVDFDMESGNPVSLLSESARDIFIAKYSPFGDFLWAKQIPGTGAESQDRISKGLDSDIPFRTQPLDMYYTSRDGGRLILSGDFDGAVTFDAYELNMNSISGMAKAGRASVFGTNNAAFLADLSLNDDGAPSADGAFVMELVVADQNGASLALSFGTDEFADPGFDALDTLAPPYPPDGAFDARMERDGIWYVTDVQPLTESQTTWLVRFRASDGGAPVTLSWDPSDLPAGGSFRIQDATDAARIDIDMRRQSVLTITDAQITAVVVTHALNHTLAVDYAQDWNLVGLPLDMPHAVYTDVFTAAQQRTLFGFSLAYRLETVLEPGRGYWIRYEQAGTETFVGEALEQVSVELTTGWNLISGPSHSVPVSEIIDAGGIVLEGTVFGFSGYYDVAEVLQPGVGYWVRASAPGTISMGDASADKVIHNTNAALVNLDAFNKIEIFQGEAPRGLLYFGGPLPAQLPEFAYTMPPASPYGGLDVRFSDNRWVSGLHSVDLLLKGTESDDSIRRLRVHSPQLENGDQGGEDDAVKVFVVTQWADGVVTGTSHAVAGTLIDLQASTTQVTLRQADPMELTTGGPSDIPAEFNLQQNFPNPFNPTTSIRFALPMAGHVRMEVFTVTGQRVAVITEGERAAGWHTVSFDGSQLSSGVYLYRLQAGSFVQTRKLLLLK
jgi:hypothetical protein